MGPMQQRLWACILYCLAVSALQAYSAITLTGQVTFADIQNAIIAINALPNPNPTNPNAADVDARTVIIQDTDGQVDFGTNSLVIQAIGVTLRGAGPGPTGKVTFSSSQTTLAPVAPPGCADSNSGVHMLQFCRNGGGSNFGTPTMPAVIENIRFENTNADYQNVGPGKGIGIYGYSGPSIAFPSRIQNCEFINLYRGGVSGVGIEFTTVGTSANWLIQNNRFEGTKQGIYLNAGPSYPNNGISVINNYFTKFFTCFRMGNNDVTTGLTIQGNTMTGGWGTGTPGNPPFDIQGIAISAAATTASQNKNWNIQNNRIEGVTQGIEIRGTSGTYSWEGVTISSNFINANVGCSRPAPFGCYNVLNGANPFPPPAMPNTWWGASPPPADKFFPNTPGSPQPDTTPWLVTWTDGTCTTGFCPTDVVDNTAVVPDITAFTVNPTTVSPGQIFEAIVTLAAPVSRGTLRFTSSPPGITCEVVPLSASDRVYTVPCTAPTATTAQAAQAAQIAAATADNPDPANTEPADVPAGEIAASEETASNVHAAAGRYNWWNPAAPAPAKQYVITAIATADRADRMTATISICSNSPWPFRADTGDCSGCAYNCATGVFSCNTCKCACHKREHPYAEALADKPYVDKSAKPTYEGAVRDGPDYGEEQTGYADKGYKEAYYRGKTRYAHKPYAGRTPDSYREGADYEEREHYRHDSAKRYDGPDAEEYKGYGGGERKWVCGTAPVTVSTECKTVTYDACRNTLECSGGGYY